ncbi:MAG: hypothetical protein KGQ79_02310 [Proteobacteria bacterium]|nr:hypothetical protein [Pseudomonadota bacterium]MBU6426186.1 hypothetical protein [Rhodospirillales bacterium]
MPGADTPAYLCPPDLLLRARQLGPLPVAVSAAAGVVLGAAVPIILTSRTNPPEATLTSVAVAQLIAAQPT